MPESSAGAASSVEAACAAPVAAFLAHGFGCLLTDIVNEGDEVWVKCLAIDDRGKVRLSMKVVDQESGQEISADKPEEAAAPAE